MESLKKNYSSMTLWTVSVAVFFMMFFYLKYANEAWFFQDDFSLYYHYATSVNLSEILSFNNFGRFISRNLYWYLLIKIFHNNAEYYYLTNLLFLIFSACLIYKVFCLFSDKNIALWVSVSFFIFPSNVHAYSWISNSQHILSYVPLFLFVWFYFSTYKNKEFNIKNIIFLSFIYLIGLMSNIIAGLVLSILYVVIVFDKSYRKKMSHNFFIVLLTILFLAFIFLLQRYKAEAYTQSLSYETIIGNIKYYFGVNLFIFVCICSLLLLIVSYVNKNLFNIWISISPVLFILPFIFLKYQRYPQYGTLSYIFSLAVFLILINVVFGSRMWRTISNYIVPFVFLFLFLFEFNFGINYFSSNPRGEKQFEQVLLLNKFRLKNPDDNNYCFLVKKQINKTKVDIWEIPPDWWFVGFGKAYKLFVSSHLNYRLINDNYSDVKDRCDVVFKYDNNELIID